VYLVLLAAAVAILAGVVAVAMGWGGEMAASTRDLPALRLRTRTAADVARLSLPVGAFGYQREATDEALHAIAGLVAARDAEIAGLREELWGLRAQRAADQTAGLLDAAETAESATYAETAEAAEPVEAQALEGAAVEGAAVEGAAVEGPAVQGPGGPADSALAAEPGMPVSEPAGTAVAEVLSGHGQAVGQEQPSS
jgi:hypothetical protein